MKIIFLIMFALALVPVMIPIVSSLCAAESLEWWEPCNDAGQNDILSFKATLIIIVSVIIAIIIVFFVVKRWRK